MLSRTYFAVLVSVITALAFGLAGEYGFRLQLARLKHDQRSNVISSVGEFRAALEGELNESLYLTSGLLAYIETHPTPQPERVQSMLQSLYVEGRHIRDFGLAPGNRITYLYPVKGNEQALGLYYPDLPDQWPAVQKAIRERRPILAGPVQLKQGGTGFIYRVPVFVGRDKKYWGMLSTVLDEDSLFAKVGIAPQVGKLNLALRGKDGTGKAGATFLGDAALFAPDSITATITTPGGSWQLAARPTEGWTTGRSILWIRVAGWITGMLLGMSLYLALASLVRRLQAEEAVRKSRDELNEAQRVGMIGSWILDLRSNRLTWSDEIFRIFEIDPSGFKASYDAFLNAIHPDDRQKVNQVYMKSVATHEPYEIVHRLQLADGRIKYVRERGETRYDENGTPLLTLGTVQDITDLHQAEKALKASEERWKFALEGSGDGVWDWNIQTGEIYLSKQEMSVLGFEGEDATNTHIEEWIARQHPDDRPIRQQALERYFSGEAPLYTCEFRTKTRNGNWRWILARGMLVSHTADGKPLRMIGTHSDISERKKVEDELIHLATTDSLTGVANRRHFMEELETELSRTRRSGRSSTLLMVDIDHFKNINDTYGHAAGDVVLCHFAELAMLHLRRADHFGRLGGEEFAFLLPETDIAGAWQFAERFRRMVADTPVPCPNRPISISFTVSIGIAKFEPDDSATDSILARADAALYKAKENGRNRVADGSTQA
jgi:diguanylate cyclase (GGDEF)-like protein/PAS domain S-box-containing protein